MARRGLLAGTSGIKREVLQEPGVIVAAGGQSIEATGEDDTPRTCQGIVARRREGIRQNNVEGSVELGCGQFVETLRYDGQRNELWGSALTRTRVSEVALSS